MALEARESKYAFSQLRRNLHFCHFVGDDAEQLNLEAEYRVGLKPYSELLRSLIEARRKRRDMMTFLCRPIPAAECPQRIRLEPAASVATLDLPRRSIQVVRSWPEGIPSEGGLTVFDESSDEYIKITDAKARDDGSVQIESTQPLVNKDSLLVKGRPLRVEREYLDELPEYVTHGNRRIPISAVQGRLNLRKWIAMVRPSPWRI